MNTKFLLPLTLLIVPLVSGCNVFDDDDDNSPPPVVAVDQFKLQVQHASPDAPAVNLLVNGNETLTDVDFKEGSAILELDVGDYEVQVDGIVPGGTATVIGPVTLSFAADKLYSVIAVDEVANIEPLVIDQDDTVINAGEARLRVVHAAPAAPAVDVFVTTPGADLAGEAPLGSFAFKENLGPVDVAAGDYQIRITLAGDPATVVFDSGSIALADGANLLVSAVQNTSTGDSPVSLALLDGSGPAQILDSTTPAQVRVVHNSADAPAVDVVVNDGFAAPLVPNLAFPNATGFVNVPADTYNVKVTAAGNAGAIVIDAELDLAAATQYSVIALNELAQIEPLVAADDARPVATAAKVRIIHGSPAAGNVDIYVTEIGADISQETATLSDVPFKTNSGFLQLAQGSYDVTVTPTGSTTAAIGPATISIVNGGVYTAIARDAVGGGTPLNLILLDDFSAPPQ